MKKLIFIILLVSCGSGLSAQINSVREEAFLHLNSNYLLSGETLYFSGYVNEYNNGQPSKLSKILYVELIGANDQLIFQQKLFIENGRASGDFFIPTLVSTGTYQLVAYTRWMRNFDSYFHTPITIVNPFEPYEIPENPGIEVTITPESNTLVANADNHLIINVRNNNLPFETKGRIVNDAGDKVVDVKTNHDGIAHVIYQPSENHNFQLILEDSNGEFVFYELPKASDDFAISIQEYPGFYQLNLLSTLSEATIEILDGEKKLLSRQITSNGSTQISKSELPHQGPFIARCGTAYRIFGNVPPIPTHTDSKEKYGTREQVIIPLNLNGTFSVSVALKNETFPPSSFETSWINRTQSNGRYQSAPNRWKGSVALPDSISYLPELRGEIIAGHTNSNLHGEVIAFSSIDSAFQLRADAISTTGDFQIQIDPMFADKKAYLTILHYDSVSTISVDDNFIGSFPELTFEEVLIDSTLAAKLAKRSVHNQIDNAYFQPLPKNAPDPILPYQFGQKTFKTYLMDDYNRFPQMYEHFIEYIPEVVARHHKNKSKLKVMMDYMLPTEVPPLILIDGLPTDPESILSFSPFKIQSIDISQNRQFIGRLVADGLVSFHTFSNDLYGFKPSANSTRYDYQGLEPLKEYVYPDHQNDESTEPDYRSQLYWNPNLSLNGAYQLEFFTSDLAGTYEMVIEGFDWEGNPISIRRYFEVITNSPGAN